MDHFHVVEGISVGGANQKDVLENPESGQRYIAKLGRRNNDVEVMTEYAVYLIGRSLGLCIPIRTMLILNCLRRRLRALRRAINARPG